MTTVLYEHPLNERIRNYLKLEQLFAQASLCHLQNNIQTGHQVFFNALFAIIDTLERNDIRGDLIKDLEKLEHNLGKWLDAPNIDISAIEVNLQQTKGLISQLKVTPPLWCQLKDDKLLSSIKQRFAIQGGSSSFDLPQLQFWLHQPVEKIQLDTEYWLSLLTQIISALDLVLKFIRQRAAFEEIISENGFYQANGEGLLLLRIKVPQSADYFPTVSGNKFRYSIRFMLPCEEAGRRYSNQSTAFQLARC
ncbi:cell division protein ZapD [Thalassomonas actiniarum]|uniref:Cell division protein ZapD n=1 Tax=Thalassomonas actiniarum TaxID=485447 RepID=A0AAF0C318_9GAMM|nr:cell division protein ZapD [Thalassomonas actiniarum]WDD98440.1 cell division protein ZapD [Thalassomonas actiniarum]